MRARQNRAPDRANHDDFDVPLARQDGMQNQREPSIFPYPTSACVQVLVKTVKTVKMRIELTVSYFP